MSIVRIFSGTSGLNNIVDPVRLKWSLETGFVELAESMNIVIDDSGRISRRAGSTLDHVGTYHSIFCNKGDCFVVHDRTSDAAIMQLGTDKSLTGVRSGLTKGARISFCQVGAKTYYSNGYQNGVITAGVSAAWPVHTHVGVDTLREFYAAPLGTHIAHFQGRMWIVDGLLIWVSEPYAYGKFRLAGVGFQFPSNVRMIKPVKGGVWVSDSEKTGFIRAADKFEDMAFEQKSAYPAHEWSESIELAEINQIPGLSAVWSSDEGLIIGSADGQLTVATKTKLIYPTGANGATFIDGQTVINTIY